VEYYDGFYGRRFLEAELYRQRRTMVETALEHGINLFAADFEFEARGLGRALKELGAANNVLVSPVIDFRSDPDGPPQWDVLRARVDLWLAIMGTDRLDLPQIRVTDGFLRHGILEDLMDQLSRLADSGKIGVPAFYSPDTDLCVLINGLDRGWFKAICRPLGILNPNAAWELLPHVKAANAGFIGFVPFQKGWLFDLGREAGIDDFEIAQTGLRWPLEHKGVTGLLCGAASTNEIKTNAAAVKSPVKDLYRRIIRFSRTGGYEHFLNQVHQKAPYLAFDWRLKHGMDNAALS
jgi:aryl-alcohol dehydrogenase-like predicted oxidoreductase